MLCEGTETKENILYGLVHWKLEKTSLQWQEANQWLPGTKKGRSWVTKKGQQRTSLGSGTVLYFYCEFGYSSVYICQNLLYCILQWVHFLLCKRQSNWFWKYIRHAKKH